MVPAMWALNGFNDLGDLGEEIDRTREKYSSRHYSRIAFGGHPVLARKRGLFPSALRLPTYRASQHVASDVVQALAGPHGAAWLTVAMAISAFGALHVVILTGARIPFAMARDGVFFRFAGHVDPKFRTRQRLSDFSWCCRRRTRPDRDLRRALFALRLRRLDFLRAQRHRHAPPARQTTKPESPLPRLGLPCDANHLPGRRNRAHVQSLDGPPRPLNSRLSRNPGRHPLLLPLAQVNYGVHVRIQPSGKIRASCALPSIQASLRARLSRRESAAVGQIPTPRSWTAFVGRQHYEIVVQFEFDRAIWQRFKFPLRDIARGFCC